MLFIHTYKTNFLLFIVFLLYNDAYFQPIQGTKEYDSQRNHKL